MYIIIAGAGEVGEFLARILVEEQHDVAIIEQDEAIARALDASLDCLVVHGSCVSHEAQERAGVAKADLVLAVTAVDEVNLIACMVAEKLGKNPRTVARVREEDYLESNAALSAADMGLDLLVGPERAVATTVMELLSYEGSGEMRRLANDKLVLLGLSLGPDSPLAHEPLADLRDDLPRQSLVAAIQGPQGLRIPRGDDRLNVDERAFVLTLPEHVDEFIILSGKPWHHVRHILIVGCGRIGFHVARALESQKLYPTIIEKDLARAEWVAKHLEKSLVLHGDGSDPDFLREQLQEEADAVVVLVEEDEKSVLIGLFAKSLGAKKVIVRCDKAAYVPIAHSMGVDAVISPRRAVANTILRYVRKGLIASTVMLGDHEGEILELVIPEKPAHAAIIHKPLSELSFPEGALLGAVIRDGEVTIPRGDTILQPGDDVLVICLPRAIHSVEKFLA